MKKVILSVYVLIVHMALAALFIKPELSLKVQEKLGVIQTANQQFSRMLTYHRAMDGSIEPGTSIFLGDSITQGLATSSVADRSVNFGIGQQTTSEMLTALPHYKSLATASRIYLLIGVNDIAQKKTDGLGERYALIAKSFPQNTPVIWSAVMPTLDKKIDAEKAEQANISARQACSSLPKCKFLETEQLFKNTQGEIDASNFVDGLHLSTSAYKKWITELRNAAR